MTSRLTDRTLARFLCLRRYDASVSMARVMRAVKTCHSSSSIIIFDPRGTINAALFITTHKKHFQFFFPGSNVYSQIAATHYTRPLITANYIAPRITLFSHYFCLMQRAITFSYGGDSHNITFKRTSGESRDSGSKTPRVDESLWTSLIMLVMLKNFHLFPLAGDVMDPGFSFTHRNNTLGVNH